MTDLTIEVGTKPYLAMYMCIWDIPTSVNSKYDTTDYLNIKVDNSP